MAGALTAADLAELEELGERAFAGPWEVWVGESVWAADGTWVADAYDDNAAFIAASRQSVPALVAAVRELARAIVDVGDTTTHCPICSGMLLSVGGVEHAPDCIVIRARALLGA